MAAAPARAQEHSSETVDEGDAPVAAEAILPVPQHGGPWATRAELTGGWGGVRQAWTDHGFDLRFEWYQIGQGIVSGGRGQDWEYGTNLDLSANIDLGRMGVLPGSALSFRAQSRFGQTVNGESGLLLPVNTFSLFPFTDPVDADVPIAITELNYLQFLSARFAILLGKMVFGGLGQNPFNPALTGRVFLLIAFPAEMTTWLVPRAAGNAPGTFLGHARVAWDAAGRVLARPGMFGTVPGTTLPSSR
jgi:hypothetical protein